MKFIKWLFISIIGILAIAEAAILISGKPFLNKVLLLTVFSGKLGPDIDELNLFPYRTIDTAKAQPWPISANYNQTKINAELMQKMESFKTTSFLVIKNDSILYENYWEQYTDKSVSNSFSMAKSFTAALIGIAIKQGLIKSVDEPVSNYIESFATGEKAKITIKHLLTMSSGLDFDETYTSPWAWPSEAYYGNDVNALTLKANVLETPGITWKYKGGDSQLLGIILKKVLGEKSISEFASENLWKKIGAENLAYWSLDKKDGMEKVSCCWYSTARDYARFAKLYMQKGNWNGEQIIDTTFINQSVQLANLKDINGNQNDKYGYQWWIMKHNGIDVFYCRGIRGQYIFAIPSKQLIVVRGGHKRASKKGDELPDDIFVYLDIALSL